MQLGVVLPNTGRLATREALVRVAECAEAGGFEALWTADHLAVPVESSAGYPYARGRVTLDPDHVFVEPLIALALVAACTSRIRLGVSVYLAALRHPLVCAKLVASLDQLSSGRVILGVGAGWLPEEYALLGIPWDERGRRLDASIGCLRALWSQERPTFRGSAFSVEGIGFEPKPLRGGVPIWVGGNGEAALRRAARLGDGWHPIDLSATALEPKLERLARLCEAQGRKLSDLTLSLRAQLRLTEARVPAAERAAPLTGPIDDVLAELQALAKLGVSHVALWPVAHDVDLAGYLARVEQIAARIVPAFHA